MTHEHDTESTTSPSETSPSETPASDASWWSAQAQDPASPEVVARTSQLTHLVGRIGRTLRWFALPAWVLALLAILPALGLVGLGLTLPGWWKVLPLALAVAGGWAAIAFLRSALATIRAAGNPAAVRQDAATFSRHLTGTVGILGELDAVVRGSRIGLLRRLAALWKVITIPNGLLEQLDALPALSWLVPPKVTDTWARLVACCWWAIVCWVGLLVLIPLKISPIA